MTCPVPQSQTSLERLHAIAAGQKIPLRGALDLTHRCNLRCVHCFLGSDADDRKKQARELATEQIFLLLNDAVEAGCLFLLISGGEPLLRPDFCEVYRYARKLGIWVTVFTNATLVRSVHCRLFRELPPQAVEVTLYGATANTYERVTGVPGSYEKCMRGIHQLLDHGIRVGLKTMVLRTNAEEIPVMEAVARQLGTSFRIDSNVFSQLDGGLQPLTERVEPARAVALELADEARFSLVRGHYLRSRSSLVPTTIYRCEAGLMSFHLDPDGKMRPCVITPKVFSWPLDEGFLNAWKVISQGFAGMRTASEEYCGGCGVGFLCSCCPGILGLEMDTMAAPTFMCEIAARRVQAIEQALELEREEL
jgi:MoaA/NifB/PqqE/SkfB family radical SAM enzyme